MNEMPTGPALIVPGGTVIAVSAPPAGAVKVK
jgi:hypothetical protein